MIRSEEKEGRIKALAQRARQVLTDHGWCQGDLFHRDGSHCLVGALCEATGNAQWPEWDDVAEDWDGESPNTSAYQRFIYTDVDVQEVEGLIDDTLCMLYDLQFAEGSGRHSSEIDCLDEMTNWNDTKADKDAVLDLLQRLEEFADGPDPEPVS